jgi:DNA processing protein
MKPDPSKLAVAVELSLVPGIGLLAQDTLYQRNPDISSVLRISEHELQVLGISAEAASALCSRRYRGMAEEIIDWATRENCHILLRGTSPYPSLLNEIHDPPLILYGRGQLEVLHYPVIAVVGTRRPTFYGLQMAQGMAYDLAKRGIGIVSGLARGIDAAAHRGCLEAGGKTIAVLGCGIDVVYPREHRSLSQQIFAEGLLLSEFVPGTSPAPQNFPVRNRIISGLAWGTMVVEASEYSGSLITARLAMEQNREVFALPGNLTSPQSFGPNYLIKQGAKLVQVWRDVVEELPAEIRQKILAGEDMPANPRMELDLLTPEEEKILNALSYDRAIQFDRLLLASGLMVPKLSELLLNLEMRGHLRQVPGNLFIRIIKRVE